MDIFNQTPEEKQAQLDEHSKMYKETWDLETTDYLLEYIKGKLRGCNLRYCLACANSDTLVEVLKERFLKLQARRNEK